MALNSPSKVSEKIVSPEVVREEKIDGLICLGTETANQKMCYEDDDKEQSKKKNKRNKEEVKERESSSKNEKLVTEEKTRLNSNRKKNGSGEEEDEEDEGQEIVQTSDSGGNHRHGVEEKISVTLGPKHFYTQRQIDSFTVRVLAIEKSLENSENRVDQSKMAERENVTHHRQYLTSEIARARSPSMPNTLTLGVPKDGDEREGSFDDASSCSSKYGLAPLLEVKRPHCTLNCENCKVILEERFRHSK